MELKCDNNFKTCHGKATDYYWYGKKYIFCINCFFKFQSRFEVDKPFRDKLANEATEKEKNLITP